jgi:hypothetical protein
MDSWAGSPWVCRHGPYECAANRHQLCLRQHVPPAANGPWLVEGLLGRINAGECGAPWDPASIECALAAVRREPGSSGGEG